jgi:hypothetical protein
MRPLAKRVLIVTPASLTKNWAKGVCATVWSCLNLFICYQQLCICVVVVVFVVAVLVASQSSRSGSATSA